MILYTLFSLAMLVLIFVVTFFLSGWITGNDPLWWASGTPITLVDWRGETKNSYLRKDNTAYVYPPTKTAKLICREDGTVTDELGQDHYIERWYTR